MNIELCIKYILRNRSEYNDWISQGFSKPWSMQIDGSLSWNETVLGVPCPTLDELTTIEPIAIAWEEQEFQNNKSYNLKMMENIYIDFLTNDWTPLLRTKGIIAQDYVITVITQWMPIIIAIPIIIGAFNIAYKLIRKGGLI